MNSLVIPPSPNWYETSILACAPDNTLVYGARNDIVVVSPTSDDQAAFVRLITHAHSQKIISVNVNKNWGQLHKLCVSLADDGIIKVWNLDTLERKTAKNCYVSGDKVVGAVFAGDERVICVNESGTIHIWNILLNESQVLKDLFGFKVTVTCLSTCPHASWLTAFGLKNGLVVVVDLRRNGKVLYKLRGHDKSVLSLSWCPAPINVFPKYPNNTVKNKTYVTKNGDKSNDSKSTPDKFVDTKFEQLTPPYTVENSPSTSSQEKIKEDIIVLPPNHAIKQNPWINLMHADDDDEEAQAIISNARRNVSSPCNLNLDFLKEDNNNFLEECGHLKKVILGVDTPKSNGNGKPVEEITAVTETIDEPSTSQLTVSDEKVCEKDMEEDKTEVVIVTAETQEETIVDKTEIVTGENQEETVEVKTEVVTGENQKETVVVKTETVTGENQEETSKNNDVSNEDGITKECKNTARCIPKNETQAEEPRKDFLLASSAKEGNIYIWRAGTDGRMQTFFTVPSKSGYRKSNDKMWITICWAAPNILLSSSKSAELLQWSVPKRKDSNQMRVVHKDHGSNLFCIAAPIIYSNEYNWSDDRQVLNAWTVGQDRLLLNTSLGPSRTNLACYSTFGGSINIILASPLDPTRLAIGTGEGVIKVWDLSRPHIKNVLMSHFYQKIQGKVLSLAWHPTNENLLAYGTTEGRIGSFDATNCSKFPTLLPHYFKSQIHNLEWGPFKDNKSEMSLFVVSEGKLVIFDVTKPPQEPFELEMPDSTIVYMFAWKPDFSKMLVSTKNGSLLVYSANLELIATNYIQQKFHRIVWHPDASAGDSKYCNWFAVTTNTSSFVIYEYQTKENGEVEFEAVATFSEAHNDIVTGLCWSPHDGNILVSVGEDGIAQVWDIENKCVLSTYLNLNFESIMSVIWSPVDPNFIIIGSKDYVVKIWQISENPPMCIKDVAEMRKQVIKEICNESSDLVPKVEKTGEKPVVKQTKCSKHCLLPTFYNPKEVVKMVSDLRRLLLWKETGAIIPDTYKMEGNAKKSKKNTEPDIFDIFGDTGAMVKLLNLNQKLHKEKGKSTLTNTVSLWKGDISATIKDAVEKKRVTPWIISLAPMVSPKLWQLACETYAQQLTEECDADPLEIATYYLACHKVEEAISVLCDRSMFREALALAKGRGCYSNIINDVVCKWAKNMVTTGAFETAAQCYIYLGRYEEAAAVLFRRTDVEILKFATELAEKSGNRELYKAVMFKYNSFLDDNSDVELLIKGVIGSVLHDDVAPCVSEELSHDNLNGSGDNRNVDVIDTVQLPPSITDEDAM